MKGSNPFAFFKFNLEKAAASGFTPVYRPAGEDILGEPTDSVARDTNLHLEVTVRDLEAQLARLGRLSEFAFAEPEVFALLQKGLGIE